MQLPLKALAAFFRWLQFFTLVRSVADPATPLPPWLGDGRIQKWSMARCYLEKIRKASFGDSITF